MKPIQRILLIAVLALLPAALPLHTSAKGWESVRKERMDARSVAKDADIEIQTAGGMIIVNTNKPVQIKVFTILGRLVTSENLPAGQHQFRVPSNGVYIVKVGDITCKVVM